MFPSDYKRKENPLEYFSETILGPMGRMVGGSKSIYRYDHPKNVVVFNANIATKTNGKIWYGDLDLTIDHKKLIELQKKIGDFYIFYESDLRFGKELEKIDFSKAICAYTKDKIIFSEVHKEYFLLKKDGTPVEKKQPKTKIDTSPSEYENKKELFKEIKIPNVKTFKPKARQSVWEIFHKELIDMYGKEKAQKIFNKLFLTKEDFDFLGSLSRKMLKKILHPAKIESTIGMDDLCNGCHHFDKKVSWAKPGVGYVKKDEEQ